MQGPRLRALRKLARPITTSPVLDETPAPLSRLPDIVYAYLRGPVPYDKALALQHRLVARRLEAKNALQSIPPSSSDPTHKYTRRVASTDILLLLQHRPVYTAGRREKDPEIAAAEEARLAPFGADYALTQRGGQVTYHGPGQLVGYPIFDLDAMEMRTRTYVELVQLFLTRILNTKLGTDTVDSEHVGVFTSDSEKIASIGIQLNHRMTLHGFALNVQDSVLPWFSNITACGLPNVNATSVESVRRQKGLSNLSVDDVVPSAVGVFSEVFNRNLRPIVDTDDADLVKLLEDVTV